MSKIIRKLRQIKKKSRLNKKLTNLVYPPVDVNTTYTVVDIVHERGRGMPYAVIKIGDKLYNIVACEGVAVGDTFNIGEDVTNLTTGTITKIKNIPEGTAINSINNNGVMYAMSAGAFCTIVNHRKEANMTVIRLPSKDKKIISSDSSAIIGICSSGGITEKPLLKAKTSHMLHRSRGQLFPKVRGVAMNPVDHPHGGGNHQHIGYPSTVSKNAPPGQRVGLIGARTTGRGWKTASNKKN